MTTTADRTLAEIIESNPATRRTFEQLGLDYCCGGQRTLRDAVSALELDLAEVTEALRSVAPAEPEEWASLGAAELVDHIESTHHAYLHAELPRLDALAAKVLAVHGDRHPELASVRSTYVELREDLEPHLAKEEQVLFPAIRRLAARGGSGAAPEPATFTCGTLQMPISVMMAEHDRAGDLLARLHDVTGGHRAPDDACASYRALYDGLAALEADTFLHVHKENNVLFPAVLGLEADSARVAVP